MLEQPIVFVIAGDPQARRNLDSRLKQLSCDVRLCHSPEEFQQISAPHDSGCILLHLAHAELDLEWLTTLGPREHHWPVICIAAPSSSGGTVELDTVVLAMKRGAIDFVLESCSDQRLLAAVQEALRWDAAHRRHVSHVQSIRRRLRQLEPPLRDVLELLLKGKSNREIAHDLGMSVRSIEVRRAKVMQTMKARSLATLVRLTLLAHGLSMPIAAAGAKDEIAQITRPPR
jgi:two-component system, LuxR family, response regulator FixJ